MYTGIVPLSFAMLRYVALRVVLSYCAIVLLYSVVSCRFVRLTTLINSSNGSDERNEERKRIPMSFDRSIGGWMDGWLAGWC